jgi:hypothetical protein
MILLVLLKMIPKKNELMKRFLKYLLLYIFSAFLELLINTFIFEKATIKSERLFVVYLIMVFYSWMFFVPLLIIFRFGLIEFSKFFNYKNLFWICIFWGAAVNFLKIFFTASTVSNLQSFSFLISGVVFGTLYYLFFLFPYNFKVNK